MELLTQISFQMSKTSGVTFDDINIFFFTFRDNNIIHINNQNNSASGRMMNKDRINVGNHQVQ